MILVDTGPLVAIIRPADQYHEECAEALELLHEPMLAPWAVIGEAMHLLKYSHEAQDALWEMIEIEVLHLGELDDEDVKRMRYLMRKYRDLPMDFADAALVALAEREHINRIFTIDRRDFSIYKPAGMKRFEIIP